VPGVGAVVLGTPMFQKATLRFAGERTLVITRSGDGIYVKNVTLDESPFATDWLPIAKIHAGTTLLDFTTQAQPDTVRGTRPQDRPPSLR